MGRDVILLNQTWPVHLEMFPLRRGSWKLLVLKAEQPVTGKIYYFVDKCLPFGASISCAIFQDFFNAVAYLVLFNTNKPLVNYLDDY